MACSTHPLCPSTPSLAAKTQRGEKTLLVAVTLARVPTTFSTSPVSGFLNPRSCSPSPSNPPSRSTRTCYAASGDERENWTDVGKRKERKREVMEDVAEASRAPRREADSSVLSFHLPAPSFERGCTPRRCGLTFWCEISTNTLRGDVLVIFWKYIFFSLARYLLFNIYSRFF